MAVLVAACAAVGAIIGVLVIPQQFSDAAATSVSTVYTTGSNPSNGTTAASADAPNGAVTGTAKPGDILQWVVPYQNNTGANATVDLTDDISKAGTYVPGSLQVPPSQSALGSVSPQYTTGASGWTTGTPPATATGVGLKATTVPQGTQQTSLPFTAPPATMISMLGGDAYNIVVRNRLVYTVYHHRTGPIVYCAQADGKTCPGWPTNSNVQYWSATVGAAIGTGTSFPGNTPQQNGTWLVGSKLYWLEGLIDNSSTGIACLDLSTTTPTSCGYTARTGRALDNSTYAAEINGTGLPASNGNTYSVAVSGSQVILLCTTPANASCAGATVYASGLTSNATFTSASFGNYVFASVQLTPASSWQTFCFNTTTSALCSGTWPVNTSPASVKAGTPFAPILSAAGVLTGICTLTNGANTSSACWNLVGAPVGNVYSGTGAIFNAGGNGTGDAYVVGAKVYLSGGNQVICLDFGVYAGSGAVPKCSGFTAVPNTINYTVRSAADIAPNCLVATGDAGQIAFFSGITGGPCTTSTPPVTMTVTPESFYCGTGAASFARWGSLSLTGLVAGTYSNSTVTLTDQNGRAIAGFTNLTVAPGQSVSLKAIPTTVTSITATAVVNAVSNPSGVLTAQMAIAWEGNPPELCFQTTAPAVPCDAAAALVLSNRATAVTISAAGSDAPAGNATGTAQFADQADPSQCGLAIKKLASVQSVRPGGRVTYTITVQNTGTQSYSNAAFTDDLTDVLKDATYNGDQLGSTGSASWSAPVLSWSGGLAPAELATITYSVTVNSPDRGDHALLNAVVSSTPGNNCLPDSTDPLCTVTVEVQVSDVLWRKTDATAAKNILPGAEWTFTPVDGAGKPTGAAITVTDCVEESASACAGADRDPLGGAFRITDLGPGTYQLLETRAPVGFILNGTPITVTVLATSTTVSLPDVQNKQLPVPMIPLTGGVGTDLLTFTGAGLLAGMLCLAVFHLLRRRSFA